VMVGGAAAEVVHLYEKASSAADAAVDGERIVTEKESRAVDALHALQKVCHLKPEHRIALAAKPGGGDHCLFY
jgi:hypothetical protein